MAYADLYFGPFCASRIRCWDTACLCHYIWQLAIDRNLQCTVPNFHWVMKQISPIRGNHSPCLIQCYLGPDECPCQMASHSIKRLLAADARAWQTDWRYHNSWHHLCVQFVMLPIAEAPLGIGAYAACMQTSTTPECTSEHRVMHAVFRRAFCREWTSLTAYLSVFSLCFYCSFSVDFRECYDNNKISRS